MMNNSDYIAEEQSGLEIAIIGMSGRFAGSKNIDEFWRNLKNGVESISFFTDEELLSVGVDPVILKNPNYVKAGVVLEDPELFDASFFNFSSKEAEITDPQLRLFMECAWQALEDAGYDSKQYKGKIGVYAGSSLSSYLVKLLSDQSLRNSFDESQILISNDKDFLTTWVSYKLDLEGPSYTVQTACSTSLVAVHLACQDLLSGTCDIALAGGVSIELPQKIGYLYKKSEILSSDGHCRAFDANAQGTVYSSGVGIVALKRLEDALSDGDNIHCVIKGSAINNDGSSKASYMAPRVDSQAKVIQNAQFLAEINPESVTFIEAHGTGTLLGDMIEISAMSQAFRSSTETKRFCAVGSVKTNIGHLKAAGGIAALIKTVLCLKHRLIPPSLHYEQPNPQIDFADSPFYINTQLSEWNKKGTPRRAGVNSFGIGGTNAHVILEEAPDTQMQDDASGRSRPWRLLLLSARTRSALDTATMNLADHLEQHSDLSLADVAYTLQIGRRSFEHRRMLVCQDMGEAVQLLKSLDSTRVLTRYQEPCSPSVVFLVPGEGAQSIEIGKELYSTEPIFREHIDNCCNCLKPLLGLDLRQILYPISDYRETAIQKLKQTELAEPALFIIASALAKLWIALGVRIESIIGCNIGEYVAAYIAGVFTLEDALALAATRGQSTKLTSRLKQIKVNPPQIPFISNTTGTWIGVNEATSPNYWSQQADQIKPFAAELKKLTSQPNLIFLEAGSGQILNTLTKQNCPTDPLGLISLPPVEKAQSEAAFFLNTLGQLWLAGVQIDWSGYYSHEKRHRLSLPTYPFERQRYSIDHLLKK